MTDYQKIIDGTVQLLWAIEIAHQNDEIPRNDMVSMACRKSRLERFKKYAMLKREFDP